MRKIWMTLICIISVQLSAQNYQIIEESVNWVDADRNDRSVAVDLYYPSDDGATIADGQFPVISFGHGFSMGTDAYENLKDFLVPLGYIVAMADTETGFAPSHANLGGDLAFIINQIGNEAPFTDHLNGRYGLMGHSMGGGASWLAAAQIEVDCLVGFAPAETDPSAIAAAGNINAPVLVFSASGDAVTPAAEHHTPIYESTISENKFFVSIDGGAHCYYANTNFACDFGESVSGGDITISREEQQKIVNDLIEPFLTNHLKGSCPNLGAFEASLAVYPGITYQSAFVETEPFEVEINVDEAQGEIQAGAAETYSWFINGELASTTSILEIPDGPAFTYYLIATDEQACFFQSEPMDFTPMTTGIIQAEVGRLHLLPNPAQDYLQLNFEGTNSQQIHLEIYDLSGQLMCKVEDFVSELRLNIADWPSGVYHIAGQVGDKLLGSRRFLKE